MQYQLVCKIKECGFLVDFREVGPDQYQQFESRLKHDCGCSFAADERAFFEVICWRIQSRKKVIDMKDTLYRIMKQRY